MYSFEGNFRQAPKVSHRGKQSRVTKDDLLKKSQEERQKRQENRERSKSVMIIQSHIRSYLKRKQLKQTYRDQFDRTVSTCNVNNKADANKVEMLTKLLYFFYDKQCEQDITRLEWISDQLLGELRKEVNFMSSFLLSQLLCICSKWLISRDENNNKLLRLMETYTSTSTYLNVCRDIHQHQHVISNQLAFWKRLTVNGFFSSILQTFERRVPSNITMMTSPPLTSPHHQLAQSLVNILQRPLQIITRFDGLCGGGCGKTGKWEDEENSRIILDEFMKQVLSPRMSRSTFAYVIPSLIACVEFPFAQLMEVYREKSLTRIGVDVTKTHYNLAAFILVTNPHIGSLEDERKVWYLGVMNYLLTTLHTRKTIQPGDDSDAESSDDDDDDRMDVDLDQTHVTRSEVKREVLKVVNSDVFIRNMLQSTTVDVTNHVTHIAFHLLFQLNVKIHTCRFLYELSYSSKFLKQMWRSLSSNDKNLMQQKCSIRLLLEMGMRNVSDEMTNKMLSKLIVFACLFNNNLLSLHDLDFYSSLGLKTESGGESSSSDGGASTSSGVTSSSANKFELGEDVVGMIPLLRDIALQLIKVMLPTHLAPSGGGPVIQTASFAFAPMQQLLQASSDQTREIFLLLSEGKGLQHHSSNLSQHIVLCGYAYKCCTRILTHLRTRYSRQHFGSEQMWSSPSFHHATVNEQLIATYMTEPDDDERAMTATIARQLIILTTIPYVIPFDVRVTYFAAMLQQDRSRMHTSEASAYHHQFDIPDDPDEDDVTAAQQSRHRNRHVINVKCRRSYLYEDAFNDLSLANAPDMRKRLRVRFINQAGVDEAGYGEGVTRAFVQQLTRAAFDPELGLFKLTTQESHLYPNPHASSLFDNSLTHFNFLGRLLGKVLYEGMRVELPLASFFLCKLLRSYNSDVDINHLRSLDPDYYKNLMFLRSCADVGSLGLNFVVIDEHLGRTRSVELVPGGSNLSVNNSNCLRYIHLLANYKLNIEIREASDAFRVGLSSVVPLRWLRMFDHEELQTLISGAQMPVDVDDLRKHSEYSGGYSSEHPTIELFWQVLAEFSEEEKRNLLLFATSCSRPPHLGFKEMRPPFCIHNGGEGDRLATSSTCLNLLRLPQYQDRDTMRRKILYSINSESGFELS